MEKKVFKFITVDNYEKEEQYLHEMSLKGWHFKEFKNLHYHFIKGDPANFYYRLDFKENLNDMEDYLDLFRGTGWEHASSYPILGGEWIYFRKKGEGGKVAPQIFTDKVSIVNLLKKIRIKWTVFGSSMILLLLLLEFVVFNYTPGSGSSIFVWTVIAVLATLYSKMFINKTRKIRSLTTD